ncbi:hypothetical protein YC2023_030282 [Brassica napus]
MDYKNKQGRALKIDSKYTLMTSIIFITDLISIRCKDSWRHSLPQKSNGKAASASTQSLSFTLLPVLVSFCICQVRVKIVYIYQTFCCLIRRDSISFVLSRTPDTYWDNTKQGGFIKLQIFFLGKLPNHVVIEGFTFYQPTDFLSIVATVGLLCVSPTPRNSLQRGNSPFLLNWLPKEFVSVISLKDHQSLISFISTIRLRFVAML